MEKEILACRSLSIGYDGAALCSGIDFTLGEGEYMCVVGHSGMGKTCFALTLMGLLKPVAGEVEYLNSLKREEIGYVPQSDEIHGPLSVRDVVLSGCLGGMRSFFVTRREKNLATEAMERLGVTHLAKKDTRSCLADKNRGCFSREPCAAKETSHTRRAYART